ncbi:MAG: AMP-binding protein, partial [Stackebrandtia sp.]
MVQPQWEPSAEGVAGARITDFARFAGNRTGQEFGDYRTLWQWSVEDLTGFWGTLWEYFDLGDAPATVLSGTEMPGVRWFPGQQLNYVDQIARHARTERPAIVYADEAGELIEISWAELLGRAASFAATLRELGVGPGDRVIGYLPNIPEAVIAFLGAAGIGAVWSACGQDYSAKAALDRLGQLEPAVLVTADGYRYGGKQHDKTADIAALRDGLPGLRATVVVSRLGHVVPDVLDWSAVAGPDGELFPERVDFDHPLWVLFSS